MSLTAPQFFGGGPHIRVVNTFLDIDCGDIDRQSGICRSLTAPPNLSVRSRELREGLLESDPPHLNRSPLILASIPQQKSTPTEGLSALPTPECQSQSLSPQSESSTPPVMSLHDIGAGRHPQPQTLICHGHRGSYFICWVVDARKLYNGNEKQAVSPPFDICLGPRFPKVTFKLMIYAKASADARGGATFKKAGAKGFVQLKCEEDVTEAASPVNFSLTIGNESHKEETRGPVLHNFGKRAACGLLKSQELWNFNDVVDKDSMTFNVLLEMQLHPTEADLPQALPHATPSAFADEVDR